MHTEIDKDTIAALPLDQQLTLLEDLRFRLDRNKRPALGAVAPRQAWTALEQDVWLALSRELLNRLHLETTPLTVFAHSFGAEKYKAIVTRLDAYVQTACDEPLHRTHKVALFRCAFGCVIEHFQEAGIPVTPTSILSNAARIPQIVDEAFPDYASARLLHRVVLMMADARA